MDTESVSSSSSTAHTCVEHEIENKDAERAEMPGRKTKTYTNLIVQFRNLTIVQFSVLGYKLHNEIAELGELQDAVAVGVVGHENLKEAESPAQEHMFFVSNPEISSHADMSSHKSACIPS